MRIFNKLRDMVYTSYQFHRELEGIDGPDSFKDFNKWAKER